MSEYEGRKFMIFNCSELSAIDFQEVLETDDGTVRRSVDGTKTFVKWDGSSIPQCVQDLTTKEGPYTYEEILDILATAFWSTPDEN
jgi:hypothetical protein